MLKLGMVLIALGAVAFGVGWWWFQNAYVTGF